MFPPSHAPPAKSCAIVQSAFLLTVLNHAVDCHVVKKWAKDRSCSKQKEGNPFPQEQCSTGKVIFVGEHGNDHFGRTLTNSFDKVVALAIRVRNRCGVLGVVLGDIA